MAEHLTDVAVGPFFTLIAVVGGMWRGVGHLHLCGTVLGVMEVKAVTDVTEQPRGELLLHRFLVMATENKSAAPCVFLNDSHSSATQLVLILRTCAEKRTHLS